MNGVDFFPRFQERTIEIHELKPLKVQGKDFPWDFHPVLYKVAR
jgi:hypothetical protein